MILLFVCFISAGRLPCEPLWVNNAMMLHIMLELALYTTDLIETITQCDPQGLGNLLNFILFVL